MCSEIDSKKLSKSCRPLFRVRGIQLHQVVHQFIFEKQRSDIQLPWSEYEMDRYEWKRGATERNTTIQLMKRSVQIAIALSIKPVYSLIFWVDHGVQSGGKMKRLTLEKHSFKKCTVCRCFMTPILVVYIWGYEIL